MYQKKSIMEKEVLNVFIGRLCWEYDEYNSQDIQKVHGIWIFDAKFEKRYEFVGECKYTFDIIETGDEITKKF